MDLTMSVWHIFQHTVGANCCNNVNSGHCWSTLLQMTLDHVATIALDTIADFYITVAFVIPLAAC
jgi:hypothetical protein